MTYVEQQINSILQYNPKGMPFPNFAVYFTMVTRAPKGTNDIKVMIFTMNTNNKQECIPVGCVPSTAMAVYGGCPGEMSRGKCPGVFLSRVCVCVCHRVCVWTGGVSRGCVRGVSGEGVNNSPSGQNSCENITFPQLLLRTVIKVAERQKSNC